MTVEKSPVEKVERTGVGADTLFHVIAAAPAIIGHLVDVIAAGRIGLGRQHAAVGELTHAQGVRRLDPLISVGVHRQIPFVNLMRFDTGQHGEITGHHQTLDMVGVGFAFGLADAIGETGHVGVASPIEGRQRAVMV